MGNTSYSIKHFGPSNIQLTEKTKLRQLGFANLIVDDSDSKPSEFDCQLQYESDSSDNFELTIAITIKNRSIFDEERSFLISFRLKDRYKSIKRSKSGFKD